MTQVVYKYVMTGGPGDTVRMWLPRGALMLTGNLQSGSPAFWARVDNAALMDEEWEFCVMFTGQYGPHNLEDFVYYGTDFDQHGLVYHFFARRV